MTELEFPETQMLKKDEAIVQKRYTRIESGGKVRKPTERELELANDYSRMFTGCWYFSIHRAKKRWCQNGSTEMHKGKVHHV